MSPRSSLRPPVVWPVRLDPTGVSGPTVGRARGPGWRRCSNGLYVPSDVDGLQPEQRIVEVAAVLPAVGGVTGWGALRWAGGFWFSGTRADGSLRPVVLAVGSAAIRGQERFGIEVSQERLGPIELTTIDGICVTSLVRAVCYEMRYAVNKRDAGVLLGMAAYSDLVSVEEAATYALAHSGWTGIPQARDGLSLSDENSWSPWECKTRHVWQLDAGLPTLLCNRPVFDRWGGHIGTPDLLDEEAGLVIEYDGAFHLLGAQRRIDRDRELAFRSAGLEYLTVMAGDFADRDRLAQRMVEARRRAGWLSPAHRAWTIELPAWWIPTFTVEQRRNLDESQRARLLRYRHHAA